MRKTVLFNDNWIFTKEQIAPKSAVAESFVGEAVTLPHTWNAIDGQDGGNDYYRGKCWYQKSFSAPVIAPDEEAWLEFRGVNQVAEVFFNGMLLGSHKGGYSTFRVNITDALKDENTLLVSADNSRSREVYPQKADFTFYGGIYRDVYMITVPRAGFALSDFGSSAIKVTPEIYGDGATVKVEVQLKNTPDGATVRFSVSGQEDIVAAVKDNCATAIFKIEKVHLWDGLDDPYLYTAAAELTDGEDKVETKFGCRTAEFDAEKGFVLNGRTYPLIGAARHQDREGAGSAITKEMQKEDMEIIKAMGATTLRLAHYQHDQYFYDLCDETGIIVWAEIPYITEHMPEGNENTVSQLTELVMQNYNHPSIVCWGLSNEITASGGVSDDLVANHTRLNDLCHSLDSTRPTTMAHVFMLSIESPLVMLPDIRSYNLYYGWYIGGYEQNDIWFDTFRKKYPDAVIGLSEYGADANPQYQASKPERGDYTETYQVEYHAHILKMRETRPYIWAMHVWNMFDFAADGRDEGGKHGINQKGLVTFDRKTKKDAFYLYKAYLSKEAFVHIGGRRYIDRAEDVTNVKVYSNQAEVTLYLDGKEFKTLEGLKVFDFEVPISGEHTIAAKSGSVSDEIKIRRVAAPNPEYILSGGDVINWFDREDMNEIEGFFSIKDTMADLKSSPEAARLLAVMMEKVKAKRGDVAQGIEIPEEMQRMMDQTPLEKMLKQAGDAMSAEDVVKLNQALSKIPKV